MKILIGIVLIVILFLGGILLFRFGQLGQVEEQFKKLLEQNQKSVEYYTYPGADHDISSPAFELAMQRSVAFFDKILKS